MDATEGENSADRAGADPGVPEPGAPQPGSGTPQPLDVDLAAMQTTQPGDADLAAIVRSVDEGQVEGVQLTVLVEECSSSANSLAGRCGGKKRRG